MRGPGANRHRRGVALVPVLHLWDDRAVQGGNPRIRPGDTWDGLHSWLGLTRSDVMLATTPTSSSFQLVSALMPAIHVGASVVLVAGLPAGNLPPWALSGTTVLVGYPLTLADVVNLDSVKPGAFRLVLSGGSPLAPANQTGLQDPTRRSPGRELRAERNGWLHGLGASEHR